ncbi:MAG TPA: histidine kinase [Candidatus Cryptobacteroides pullicola]|nr:histidine kinase [Candidatus Cryptobacteroides pullicola]
MKSRNTYIGIVAALAVLALVLYAVELLTSEPVFYRSFSLNYAISLPFMLLSIIIDCLVALVMNGRRLRRSASAVRIAVEMAAALLVAALMVFVGNLPFVGDMHGYIRSAGFLRSVAAAALMNAFILATVEFLIQTGINRRLQKENAVMQYRQLRDQMNPHFLFNSLNVLVSLINNRDRELAARYTKELSAVYRYVLTQNGRDTVTVGEETEFVFSYIDILKARFGEGLRFSVGIRPDDMRRAVPPMSLQVLIENAVKHNSASPENPLAINISSDGSCLRVSNNVNPRLSCAEGTGTGLANLSKKYELLTGGDISVTDDGKVFSVRLPLL